MSFKIHYLFEFESSPSWEFEVELDDRTISFIPKNRASNPPEWTKLSHCQCVNCPLKIEETSHCPVAVNMSEFIDHFNSTRSIEITKTTVTTEVRTYQKTLPIQYGLFSIFGIIMATSGCPAMNFLKPMARFHLPFSTMEESIIRSVSMYLLRQYFLLKRGLETDMNLSELDKKYEMIGNVNSGMVKRIQTVIQSGDANQNAIVILDAISKMLSLSINEKMDDYEYLFTDTQN